MKTFGEILNESKSLDDYSVDNVKVFDGNEGVGFQADLLLSDKKIATVTDKARGGSYDYSWKTGNNGPDRKKFISDTNHYGGRSIEADDKFVGDLVNDAISNNKYKKVSSSSLGIVSDR